MLHMQVFQLYWHIIDKATFIYMWDMIYPQCDMHDIHNSYCREQCSPIRRIGFRHAIAVMNVLYSVDWE